MKDFAPGRYSISATHYHLMTDYVSNSHLGYFERSPAHYREAVLRADPPEPTPAMRLGSILHKMILEPDTFFEQYAEMPEGSPRRPTDRQRFAKKPSPETVFAVEWWDAFERDNVNKEIVTSDEVKQARAISEAIRTNPAIGGFFKDGLAEQTYVAEHPATGLKLKCRPDWIVERDDVFVVIDLKSTVDARPFPFQRSAWNYGYFRQAAFYCDVIGYATERWPDAFLFVAFEKEPPYGTCVYKPAPAVLYHMISEYEGLLQRLSDCRKRNEYPGYTGEILDLEAPNWADIRTGDDND